jgi:hypothetical protein
VILKINFTVVREAEGKHLSLLKQCEIRRGRKRVDDGYASPTVVLDIIFVNKRLQPVILTRNESLYFSTSSAFAFFSFHFAFPSFNSSSVDD